RSDRLDALAPGEIALGLAKICAPQRHVRLGRGGRRAQGPHRAHGLCELGFRLRERNWRVGLVELDERVAAVHVFGIVRAYREHRAGDLRGDLDEVAADVSVVRGLVVLPVQEPPEREAGPGEEEDRHDADEKRPSFHCTATCRSKPPPRARMRLIDTASSRAWSSARSVRCSRTCISAASTCSRLPMPAWYRATAR